MTGADWIVLAAGAAAIAWVNWYFFKSSDRSGRGKSSGVEEHHHG